VEAVEPQSSQESTGSATARSGGLLGRQGQKVDDASPYVRLNVA